MKKYGDLIQFEPVTTIIKLKESAEQHKAQQLVASYVISDKMSQKLADIIIPQLQFEESVDNKSLWVVGNYGSGKSHLMSVISAVAEFPELAQFITNDKVREAANKIAGKFKVIRFEVGASKKAFADIVTDNLTSGLAEMGIDYQFPAMDEISSNHKPYFEEMMALFHERYPDQGLLLICDEILDYLRSRNQQQLPLDMAMMRVMGEVIDGTRFRFICGVQEAIFDSTQLAFATQEVKRIRDRAEQVLITRDDIKYVVAERLLKKDAQQLHWIREYLQQFTPCFDRMNERLDEFVRMFPVHPDYINTFERVRGAGIEQRQVLRSLSRQMQALMEQVVPTDKPGVFSYDTYWDELRNDPSAKTNPDIGKVIDVGETLFTRIEQSYPIKHEVDFAKRLVAGLAIHRLSVGNIYNEMGATAAELRDSLCLYLPGIEQLPGDTSNNLETQIVAILSKIRKTVNGQFFSKNKANDQFFLDLDKVEDYDAFIEGKVPLLTDDSRNNAYRVAMLDILGEPSRQHTNTQMWEHQLKWQDRNVNRPGWLFLGSPNERETAKPPLDYYMYFIQPYNPPKLKKEFIRSDEVLFILQNADAEFDRCLNYYAAAIDLHASTTGNAKNVYKLKADSYLKEMLVWLKEHFKDAYIAQYHGQNKPMMDWLKGTSVRNISGLGDSQIGSLKDIFEAVASHILANHFEELAPEYPTFSQWITYENIESAAKDALSVVSGGAATKRANAVLDALELLDGDKIAPLKSRYAQAVLAVLQGKQQGQVVNQAELLVAINSRLYFKPDSFRLEPEWLLVLIACLVYSGELELVVVGHTLTASDVVKFKSIAFDVLRDFKHIQAPKDFNITALKALLTLLEMNDGLATSIQQGNEDVVREMLKRIEALINELVKGQQSVKERLPLWGQSVLEESDEQTLSSQLNELKNFLEIIARYDKPGKLKNLKVTAAEIATYQQRLQAWQNFVQLKTVVSDLTPLCVYLKEAQLVLPESHAWQEQVKQARDVLRQGLANPSQRGDDSFKASQLSALTTLKTEYAKHYVELYMRAHLDSQEEKTKAKLLNDERLAELEILSGISLLPTQQLVDWRKAAAQLQAAKSIDTKQLAMNANPMEFNARQESAKAPASEQLKSLEQRLDSLQSDWLSNLMSLLDDPFINLGLLKAEQAQLIRDFIQQGQLPDPLDSAFVQAVNQVLAGLEEVRVSAAELVNALGQGLPQGRDEIADRFNRLLNKLCQGKDIAKVRIIID